MSQPSFPTVVQFHERIGNIFSLDARLHFINMFIHNTFCVLIMMVKFGFDKLFSLEEKRINTHPYEAAWAVIQVIFTCVGLYCLKQHQSKSLKYLIFTIPLNFGLLIIPITKTSAHIIRLVCLMWASNSVSHEDVTIAVIWLTFLLGTVHLQVKFFFTGLFFVSELKCTQNDGMLFAVMGKSFDADNFV